MYRTDLDMRQIHIFLALVLCYISLVHTHLKMIALKACLFGIILAVAKGKLKSFNYYFHGDLINI